MLVNPIYGAGGSEPIEFFMENGLVGDEGGFYITTPLDKEIPVGTPLCISMYDASPSTESSPTVVSAAATMPQSGATISVSAFFETTGEHYDLRISTTGAGLVNYAGAWRKIYAKISRAVIYDDQIYHET